MASSKSFDFLCSCLSLQVHGQADPSVLRQKMVKGVVNWQEIVSIADKHYVLPLLHFMLVKKGLTRSLPDDLQKTLSTLFELNRQRNERLKQQVLEIVQRLNTIKVAPVLLKGATALFSTLYPNSACRMMGDLDSLVPENRLEDCVRILERDGYRAIGEVEEKKDHHHWTPLARPDRIGAVELHREIAAEPVARLLDAETIRRDAIMVQQHGLKFQLCSDTHLAMHNILHHQLSGINLYDQRTFSLYQVYDLVQLMQLPEGTIGWKKLLSRFKQLGYGKETTLYFILIKELFHQPLPSGIPKLNTLRGDWLLTKGQIKFPILQYYFRIFLHLLKYREQRAVFIRQLITPNSYIDHYRRLCRYLHKPKTG